MLTTVYSGASLYYSKMSDIPLCYNLLPTKNQCYVVLSTITKSVEIQRVLTLVLKYYFDELRLQ
jgi:hypothetical protein